MVDIGEPKREIVIEPFPETIPQEEPRPSIQPASPEIAPAPAEPAPVPEEVPV